MTTYQLHPTEFLSKAAETYDLIVKHVKCRKEEHYAAESEPW